MDNDFFKKNSKLHAAGEDYLKTIFMLQKEGKTVRQITLAKYMKLSKPTISHAISSLQAGGYLEADRERCLHLTITGKKVAETMYKRHRFIYEQLLKVGVDAQVAEIEACKLEHCICEDTFQKLRMHCQCT